MEFMQQNIVAACPSAFHGISGTLFAGAVTTLIAAQCSIFDDKWPIDHAADVIRSAKDPPAFDFIVVGAGTAGSVIASRLTNVNPSWSVLLIEAGDDPGLNSEIPAFVMQNQNTTVDWSYKTSPDGNSCLGFKNHQCVWSKGKAMGGSSSINVMLYIRGHPEDYNTWGDAGNPGWNYDDLKPYFERVEEKLQLHEYKNHENPWYGVLKSGWNELGYPLQEGNDEAHIGTRITKTLIRNGKRLNTGKEYLKESKNILVMKNTIVRKVNIDPDTKIATGVEIQHTSGVKMNISATKEVILSAGSIATPQILMLSGIGPKKHLEDIGIPCIQDLPVGKNLQDHILLPFLLKTNQHLSLSSEIINSFLFEYMQFKTGPFSNIGLIDFMGFINTNDSNGQPDVQFHNVYYTQRDQLMFKAYFETVGYKDEILLALMKLNEENDLIGVHPTLIRPKSKGEIVLATIDPNVNPIVKSNYFQDVEDVKTLIKAIKFVKRLEETQSFKQFGIEVPSFQIPGCTQHYADTDEYWECYVRHIATTVYHPVGTAKMGPKSDTTAVVNHDLLVHGVNKLRVVDASVMPFITGANTVAPTMVIAEKAADILKKIYSIKEEL